MSLVAKAIPTPRAESVYSTCSYAYEVASVERESYRACADRQLDACKKRFDAHMKEKLAQVQKSSEYNCHVLDAAKSSQARCARAATSFKAAVNIWQKGGPGRRIEYNPSTCSDPSDLSSCPAECSKGAIGITANLSCTCAQAARALRDTGMVQSEAYSGVESYALYSTKVVVALAEYAAARQKYDRKYVVNHTAGVRESLQKVLEYTSLPSVDTMNAPFQLLNSKFDSLVACASLRDSKNATACAVPESVLERYEEVMAQIDSQLSRASEVFEDYASAAMAYSSAVNTAVANMDDFYTSFKNWVATAGIDTADFGLWFGLTLDDLVVPDMNPPSSVGITAGPVGGLPSDLWAQVAAAVQLYLGNLTAASLETRALTGQWVEVVKSSLETFPGFGLDDYSPPTYSSYAADGSNMSDVQPTFEKKASAFVAMEADALSALASPETIAGDFFSGIEYDLSAVGNSFDRFMSGLPFSMEPLVGPRFDVKVWIFKFGNLVWLLVWADYAWRAHQSLLIFARFWRRSGVDIPDTDINRGPVETMRKSGLHTLTQFITSPVLWGACLAAFAAVALAYLAAIYWPVLEAYKSGCVTGASNGTFVTKNVFSIAFNTAAAEGNEELVKGLSDYNTAKASSCAAYAASSRERQMEQELAMKSLRSAQQSFRDELFLLEQCVDVDRMNRDFAKACCGQGSPYDACDAYGPPEDGWGNSSACPVNLLGGGRFAPPSAYLSEAACDLPRSPVDWDLKDAVLECGQVPDCATTCDGPSKPWLEASTRHCGCTGEWLLHAALLQGALGLAAFGVMNASRVLFVSGLCKLWWRFLSPGLFSYRATCDRHGKVLAPKALGHYKALTGPGGLLKAELDRTLRRFVSFAWIQIAAASVLSALLVFAVLAVTEELSYEPHATRH
eukprot:CAMPEP_0172608578 /NCGR_PEP_ID=MMETSP1068-20121228/28649_1 /TAXON_ID=35684 /ORGANISM="Pseudopedinella elastica, Strain CCMP716" /LENGTH=903 /DNA_ID=CAMNT_0013411879 /DNA_START=189 /DNA_END=2900 /DNA_ORIENTATION=+